MDRWVGRVALVTGASVGIGRAIAENLVKHGMTVVGCARNVQQIQDLAETLKSEKESLTAIQCDIANEDAILRMFTQIKEKLGGVDVCINNAGLSHPAPLLTAETWQWEHIFDVNVIGLSICTREAVRSMRDRGVDDGHVIHISSMGAYENSSDKDYTMYCASKWAVRALCEGLRRELRQIKSHIRASEVSPGFVSSEFVARVSGEDALQTLIRENRCLTIEDVAASVEYILAAPPHVEIHDVLMYRNRISKT